MKKKIHSMIKRARAFRPDARMLVYTLLIMSVATAASALLHKYFIQHNNVTMIYALAVVAVSCVTSGYFYGILASVISVFGVNYFFTTPFWALNFSMTGYPITFLMMLVTSVVTSTLVTGYRERDRAMMDAEKEKLRSNLLRAISHDLRTPITSIFGSSTLLLENGCSIKESDIQELLMDIRDNSEWLIRMVENLLSVTRIQGREGSIHKIGEMAEEIAAQAVFKVRRRFRDQKISIKASEFPIMAPMDGTLIEQVIINLIENAVFHSGVNDVIEVNIHERHGGACFVVRDHGKGIDVAKVNRNMEGYADPDHGDNSRGIGIGLSLCAAIVKAHGG